MTGPRIAALCKGYGGLDLGLQNVLGGSLVAYAEIKPAAVALLADRYPDVPNLGDLTVADWTGVEADIVTAGWPCQPHSAAGKRLGEEDPRAIWPAVLDVVRVARPLLFVGENVARTATNGELRRALRSLAAIGYVGAWRCLAAADLGAPHKRDRLCLVAVDGSVPHAEASRRVARWAGAAGEQWRPGASVGSGELGERVRLLKTPTANLGSNGAAQHPDFRKMGGHGTTLDDEACYLIPAGRLLPTPTTRNGTGVDPRDDRTQGIDLQTAAMSLLPTPTARDHKGVGWGDQPGRPLSETIHRLAPREDAVGALLPTPSASSYGTNQGGSAGRVGPVRESLDTMAKRGRFDEPDRLLPTPTVVDSKGGPNATSGRKEGSQHHDGWTLSDVAHADRWGAYAPAVARWEAAIGQPAPAPTQPSTRKPYGPQLSPAFVEWMMGLPEGWVTGGAPGLGHDKRGNWTAPGERNAFLSLLGDGVVPQWAAAQVAFLLPIALEECALLEEPLVRDREAEVVVVADMEPTHARLTHLARNARDAGLWSDEVRARFSARKVVVLQNALVREAKDAEDVDTLKALARRAVRDDLWTDDVRAAFTARKTELLRAAA